jgi:hypothetical protein
MIKENQILTQYYCTLVLNARTNSTADDFFRIVIPHILYSYHLSPSYFYLLPSKTCLYRQAIMKTKTANVYSQEYTEIPKVSQQHMDLFWQVIHGL